MKGKLGIQEDILIERVDYTGKIQRNDRTKNRKKTIVVRFLNFKDKSRVLQTFKDKKLWKEKYLCKREFFGVDSQHS